MSTNQAKLQAASLVSRRLTSQDDVELIADLLDVAAGKDVRYRSVSLRQYNLLEAHRVLTLVPSGWMTPAERNLSADKRERLVRQMKLVAEARRVVRHLTSDGIECRILKGLATSELDYPDQAQRTFGDIDLLLRPSEFRRGVDSLAQHGVSTSREMLRRSEFTKGARLDTTGGIEVDLHYRLTNTAEPPAELFDTSSRIEGQPYKALPPALRLMHAAAHLMLSSPGTRRLSSLADISAIQARHAVDLDEVRSLAKQMRCEGAVAQALSVERIIRGLPVNIHWHPPSRLELYSYLRCTQNVPGQFIYQFSTLNSLKQRERFVRLFVVPSFVDSIRRRGIKRVLRRLPSQSLGGIAPDDAI